MSLNCFSQWGIKAGPSASWFNAGDNTYNGINHAYVSITGGLFYKTKHIQYELLFSQGGAKNPIENNRTFKTYVILLPITYKINLGAMNLQAGMYASKLLGASNSDFFTPGNNFSWRQSSWKWYQNTDLGFVVGAGVNLHPAYIEAKYRHGIKNVRQYDYDSQGVYDPSYQGCMNAAIDISLYVPFNLK